MNENIFNILDEIIDSSFKLSSSGGIVEIKEKKSSKCNFVNIQISNKTFALSLDNNKVVFNCFNSAVKKITKKNDAILFFIKKQYLIVLVLELKSDNPKGYLEQLKAGKNFVEYLLNQIDLFYKIKIDKTKILYRGILFKTKKSPSKGTTKKRGLIFEDRNGLYCASLECNRTYKLQMLKNSIDI